MVVNRNNWRMERPMSLCWMSQCAERQSRLHVREMHRRHRPCASHPWGHVDVSKPANLSGIVFKGKAKFACPMYRHTPMLLFVAYLYILVLWRETIDSSVRDNIQSSDNFRLIMPHERSNLYMYEKSSVVDRRERVKGRWIYVCVAKVQWSGSRVHGNAEVLYVCWVQWEALRKAHQQPCICCWFQEFESVQVQRSWCYQHAQASNASSWEAELRWHDRTPAYCLHADAELKVKGKFDIAYLIAKYDLAFTMMKPLCELEERHELGGARDTKMAKHAPTLQTILQRSSKSFWYVHWHKLRFLAYKQMVAWMQATWRMSELYVALYFDSYAKDGKVHHCNRFHSVKNCWRFVWVLPESCQSCGCCRLEEQTGRV